MRLRALPLLLAMLGTSLLAQGHGKVALRWRLDQNFTSAPGVSRSTFILVNQGENDFPASGWTLYFNFARALRPQDVPRSIRITHINGDFYKIEPAAGFPTIAPGKRLELAVSEIGAVTNVSGAPAGPYLVWSNGAIQPIRDYRVLPILHTRRSLADHVPLSTPKERYEKNLAVHLLPSGELPPVLPTPLHYQRTGGHAQISAQWTIDYGKGLRQEAGFLQSILARHLEHTPGLVAQPGVAKPETLRASSLHNSILLRIGTVQLPDPLSAATQREAYRLSIAPHRIVITAASASGVFYGVESLRQLLPIAAARARTATVALPGYTIIDAPRFHYRGLLIDAARNFHPEPEILKFLDAMALYKMNRLELHLDDDEGWRLQVPSLPELTSVGGFRGQTVREMHRLYPSFGSGPYANPAISHGSGYFTGRQFVKILRYARERHIEVVPEIESPGHSRAAIVAMKARAARLTAAGKPLAAAEYLLSDPHDQSVYGSVQGWNDNVINVCEPSTYRFYGAVIDRLQALYRRAGLRLRVMSLGGDEVPAGVWERSPACASLLRSDKRPLSGAGPHSVAALPAYFFQRMAGMLQRRGIRMAGWDDVVLTRPARGRERQPVQVVAPQQFRAFSWDNVWGDGNENNAYRLANLGYPVVLASATNLYFDLAYDRNALEPGYSWAGYVNTHSAFSFSPLNVFGDYERDSMGNPIAAGAVAAKRVTLSASGVAHILGLQGNLWGENAKGNRVSEYLAFPKLLAAAERAWAPESRWEALPAGARRQRELAADWNVFANVLGQRELQRLAYFHGGIACRLPPPGAVLREGRYAANGAYPGLVLRYTLDGSRPTAHSPRYVAPVTAAPKSVFRVAAFDSAGRSSRTTTISNGLKP